MLMIEVFISFICLVSLIVILLEAQHFGGFRRKWPIAIWAVSLVALALLALLRVFVNLDDWSDGRILMGVIGAGNFFFGAGLLVRWLFWTPPSPDDR
jgi:protein-S-isoprenylcysteine O-methyltransferase Ste14